MVVGHDVPVSKKLYLELVSSLAHKSQKAHRESIATTRFVVWVEGDGWGTELNVCPLSDEFVAVSDFKKQLSSRDARIADLEQNYAELEYVLAVDDTDSWCFAYGAGLGSWIRWSRKAR